MQCSRSNFKLYNVIHIYIHYGKYCWTTCFPDGCHLSATCFPPVSSLFPICFPPASPWYHSSPTRHPFGSQYPRVLSHSHPNCFPSPSFFLLRHLLRAMVSVSCKVSSWTFWRETWGSSKGQLRTNPRQRCSSWKLMSGAAPKKSINEHRKHMHWNKSVCSWNWSAGDLEKTIYAPDSLALLNVEPPARRLSGIRPTKTPVLLLP